MKDDWRLIKLFYSYVSPYRIWVYFAVAAIPVTTAAAIVIPWLIVKIVDDHLIPSKIEGLQFMLLMLLAAVVIGYVMDALYTYSLQHSGQQAIADLRKALYEHSLSLPRIYFDKTPIGVTLSRMTSDMEAIGESLAVGVMGLFVDITKTLALLALLFYLSWQLTLVIMVVIPIVYFIVSQLRQKLRNYFNLSREALAQATSYLTESLNGIKTIQLFAAEKKVAQVFYKRNQRFLKAQNQSNIYDAALFSLIEGITTVTLAMVIWYGAGEIIKGAITIGVLIGFINTLNKIFIPIREFAQQVAMIQRALAALEHIDKLLKQEPEKEGEQAKNLKGFDSLEFKDVHFQYGPESEKVLNGVSFTLEKGKKLAIVGATGSGKSTILRLITKSYRDYTGEVHINGQELDNLSKAQLLTTVSLMQQDVYLFNEALSFNISLERPNIGMDEIESAAKYVYAHGFIDDLDEKYQTKVVDNGKNLSAGQAQLISFARAIAGRSELILLDEATSSVDSVTEDLIQKAIDKILAEKTVIAVAHRLSTVRKADMILVMKKGEIIERGDHQSLVDQGGYYLELLKDLDKKEG